jgi:hypothetical protein
MVVFWLQVSPLFLQYDEVIEISLDLDSIQSRKDWTDGSIDSGWYRREVLFGLKLPFLSPVMIFSVLGLGPGLDSLDSIKVSPTEGQMT